VLALRRRSVNDGAVTRSDASSIAEQLVRVIGFQGSGTNSAHVRDLKGAMEREGAALGIFLTLNDPTREMEKEAASAAF
jgi:hypothetical protein